MKAHEKLNSEEAHKMSKSIIKPRGKGSVVSHTAQVVCAIESSSNEISISFAVSFFTLSLAPGNV